jgi:hypothetical protein
MDFASATAGQGDGTTAVKASEISRYMEIYEFNRMSGLTDMTYEDFLKTYGVHLPEKENPHKPELIRYVKEWTYPTNTVDPTDGTPSSACSWSIREKADKARYFAEPGFIFGVTLTRPKIYVGNATSAAVMSMNDAKSWLPAVLADDPWTSMRKHEALDGPIPVTAEEYWWDIKDLFLYGDQYINFDGSADKTYNKMNVPDAALSNKQYPSLSKVDDLFIDEADVSGLTKVRQDGVVSLTILGKQTDTSPNSTGNAQVTFT